jgi:hypothetical protein
VSLVALGGLNMFRQWAVMCGLLLCLTLRGAQAEDLTPWLNSIVGSPRNLAPSLPQAITHVSASALRELGDISVVVNVPQTTAQRDFRSIRSGESPYEYLRSAIREAAEGRVYLRIPKGVYSLKVPDTTKSGAHIELRGIRDVALDFQGSTLIFQDLHKIGFLLADCSRVAIMNATMWWSGISHVMGEVVEGRGKRRIRIHPDYLPYVEGQQHLQQKVQAVLPAKRNRPHLWDLENYSYEYHSPSGLQEFDFSKELESYVPMRPGLLDAFKVGQSVLVQNIKFGSNAFQVIGGSDLTIRQCTIGHTPGMGLFSPYFERGLAWIENKIMPVSHPLHLTTTADGVHLRNMGGDFIIKGSTFERTTDDPVNIYAGLSEVVAAESDSTFLIRPRHIVSDAKLFRPGTQVLFVDTSVRPRGRAFISSVDTVTGGLVRIRTSRPLPSVKEGHSAFLENAIPRRGVISDNHISGVRGRAGIVLQAVSTSVIRNTIRYTTGPAIIAGGFQNWYIEGPLVANNRIRDNIISHAGLAAFYRLFNLRGVISIGTGTKEPLTSSSIQNYQAHLGIAIVRNTISDSAAPSLQIRDAHSVWLIENKVVNPVAAPKVGGRYEPSLEIRNSCNIAAHRNELSGPSSIDREQCDSSGLHPSP